MPAPPRLESLFGPALWRSGRGRALLWQVAGGVLLIAVLASLLRIAHGNLVRQNVAFGFGFLRQPAGIDIAESVVPYAASDSIGWLIAAGAANTLHVCIVVIMLATVIGVAAGILRLSDNPLMRALTGGYVHAVRNTPLLLQILLCYAIVLQLPPVRQAYSAWGVAFLSQRGLQLPGLAVQWAGAAFPVAATAAGAAFVVYLLARRRFRRSIALAAAVCGAAAGAVVTLWLLDAITVSIPVRRGLNFVGGTTLSPEFTALVISQSLYAGAFIAELVRGGILGVPEGQKQAGRSLGISEGKILFLVVIPQALIAIIPPATSQYVGIIKNSSLAIAIGFPDLFWALTMGITISGQSLEGVLLILVAYLTPTLAAAALMELFNRRLLKRGKP